MVKFREYSTKKDKKAVIRLWKEIGWFTEGKEDYIDDVIKINYGLVAEVNGNAECLVVTTPGCIRYLREDLPFSGILAVGTGRIARKQGLAQKLCGLAVAKDAHRGALVSGLGMFEQGFYNQLGFGTGSYEHSISFDPAQLQVDSKARIPSRLTKNDWKKVHESLLKRKRGHGGVILQVPQCIQMEMEWSKNGFGLGYFNKNDELTHHAWFEAEKVEHGPYSIKWIAYQTYEQFLELMAMVKTLEDQVRLITMAEPSCIQMQDFIETPFKNRQITKNSQFESHMKADAWWQMRILHLEECLKKTHLFGEQLSFNIVLEDPIQNVINDRLWGGISGRYVVTLGPHSHAEKGIDHDLPTLKASAGAFTRMWLGIRPATGLAVTDALSGPKDLLNDLDRILCIPEPHPDFLP